MGKYNKIIGGKRHDGECDTGSGIGSYNGCIYGYRGNNGRKTGQDIPELREGVNFLTV